MSDRYMDQLSDYLDGALDAPERLALEEHLAGCDECRTTLDELRAIVAQANALAPVEPATDLWPAIAARIESERELMMPLPAEGGRVSARGGSRRRLSFTIPQLAAAAVVLVLASGGSVWMLRGGNAVAPTAIAPAGAVVPVSSGSTDADLAELEAVLATGERQLDPATVAVLRRNLLIIEQALVEAQAALEADPANPYLSRHYQNTLNKKRELLQHAATVARGST